MAKFYEFLSWMIRADAGARLEGLPHRFVRSSISLMKRDGFFDQPE
jgi:hypothetical protein